MVQLCGTSHSSCGYCEGRRTKRGSVAAVSRTNTSSTEDGDTERHEKPEPSSAPILHRPKKAKQQLASYVDNPPSESSEAYYMIVPSTSCLSPVCYEDLLYRGWRRSGRLLYQPSNSTTCCPQYTIRLPVSRFQPTKSQRKVLRQVQQLQQYATILRERESKQDMSCSASSSVPEMTTVQRNFEQWLQTSPHTSLSLSSSVLTIETVPANESILLPEVHQLYFDYQHKIHHEAHPFKVDQDNQNSSSRHKDSPKHRPLPAPIQQMFDRTYKNSDSASFSRRQQQSIHDALFQFYEFLVDNPFLEATTTVHQLYRVYGKLVAVGVLDQLPEGLSSVYCFYDAGFASSVLPLGKYTILQEIEYCPKGKYYYLGYYIDSCTKMKYKGEYRPSELLCPRTFQWMGLDEAVARIRKESPLRQYCVLFPQDEVADDSRNNNDFTHIRLWYRNQILRYDDLNEMGQEMLQPLLQEFIHCVGPTVHQQLVVQI